MRQCANEHPAKNTKNVKPKKKVVEKDIFTPFTEEWKLGASDIEAACKLFAKDPGKQKNAKGKPQLYMYAKVILAGKSSVVRKTEFNELLEGKTVAKRNI